MHRTVHQFEHRDLRVAVRASHVRHVRAPSRASREGRTPETQWPYQIWALLLTLTFSIVGGALCGTMMRMLPGVGKRYRDDSHWTVEAGLPAP